MAERLSAHLTPHLGKTAAMRAAAAAAGRGGDLAEALAQETDVLDVATLKSLCDPEDHLGAADQLVQRVLRAESTG